MFNQHPKKKTIYVHIHISTTDITQICSTSCVSVRVANCLSRHMYTSIYIQKYTIYTFIYAVMSNPHAAKTERARPKYIRQIRLCLSLRRCIFKRTSTELACKRTIIYSIYTRIPALNCVRQRNAAKVISIQWQIKVDEI